MLGKCRLLFAGIAFLSPLASLAHHAFALDFDKDLDGQVSGVVTRVSFRNPHVRYFVEVTADNGESKTWELQPPGNVAIFRLSSDPDVAMKKVDTEYRPIAEIDMGLSVYSSPVFANNVL